MAYWSTQHDLRFTPARLMLGKDLQLPVDLIYSRPEEEEHCTTYTEALPERLERVHAFARAHLKMSSDKIKHYYDACRDNRGSV